MGRARVLRRVVLAVAVLLVGYFGVTFVQVWWAGRHDGARPAQALVVLGAAQYNGRPSPVLRARLDHVVDLYDAGVAPIVVVTGGRAEGDRFTEAGVSATYLHRQGVPETAILREASGRNSWQSLGASARFLRARGIRSVVLVSDPFHAARIEAMAEELGLEAATSPTRTSPISGMAELRHLVTETAQVGIGRIIGFRRLVRANEVGRRVSAMTFGIAPGRAILAPTFGGGEIGITAGSGPAIRGSNPCPRAK